MKVNTLLGIKIKYTITQLSWKQNILRNTWLLIISAFFLFNSSEKGTPQELKSFVIVTGSNILCFLHWVTKANLELDGPAFVLPWHFNDRELFSFLAGAGSSSTILRIKIYHVESTHAHKSQHQASINWSECIIRFILLSFQSSYWK